MVILLLLITLFIHLFDFSLDIDVDKLLLTRIEFGEERVIEEVLTPSQSCQYRENLDQAKDAALAHVSIRVVYYISVDIALRYK